MIDAQKIACAGIMIGESQRDRIEGHIRGTTIRTVQRQRYQATSRLTHHRLQLMEGTMILVGCVTDSQRSSSLCWPEEGGEQEALDGVS